MVLGGNRNKYKNAPSGGTQAKTAVKLAPVPSVSSASGIITSESRRKTKLSQQISSDESDTELFLSQKSSQEPAVTPNLIKQFEKMLHKALKITSEQITNNLTKEIRELGNRTAALEIKTEELENTTQEFMTEIDLLKEENIILQNKLEDYENRARRSNLRFRGIPESIVDLSSTITALCQELQPGIPIERLEMDRVHRALMPKKTDGPPRDIIAKFHFYRTKEQLLFAAREKKNLTFQGHNFQIFADLSQVTISKRRAMKIHLLELQRNNITYQWGFPFSIRFTYQGNRHICRSPNELQQALQDLNLINGTSAINTSRRRTASASSLPTSSPAIEKNGNQHVHKRGRYISPPQEQEVDPMD